MLSLARARHRRARQLRFQTSKSLSVDQSMECDQRGIPQVTAPKGSFKHLAQSLVRLQTLKTQKPGGDIHDPMYGASRGSYRKTSNDTSSKQSWQSDNKIPETLFGYSAKYAVYVQIFIILMLTVIAAVIVIRGPVHNKSLKNSTETRRGYSSLEFHNAIFSDRCTLDRIDINSFSEELFNSSYRLSNPFILSYKRGAKSWLDTKLWEINSLKGSYGGLSVLEESWDSSMDHVVRREESLLNCLEEMKSNPEHITGNQMCFLNNDTLKSSDLLSKLKIPPVASPWVGDSVYNAQVSRLGSSIGWNLSASDSWNALIHGSKRWLFIKPPLPSPNANTDPLSGDAHDLMSWIQESYPSIMDKGRFHECVQTPGDILYMPETYYWLQITTMGSISIKVSAASAQTETARLYQTGVNADGDKNNRLKVLQELAKHLPGDSSAIMELASALEAKDKNIEAIDTLKNYLSHGFKNDQVLFRLTQLLDKVGRDNEAEDILQDLIEKGDATPKAYFELGQFLLGQQKPKQSTQLLREAVQKFPLKRYLWDGLVAALRQSGEKTKAKQVERELKKWKRS